MEAERGSYKQKYRKKWESQCELKLWIRPCVGNEQKARCFYCKCDINARYADLMRHTATQKHINAVSPFSDKRHMQPKLNFKTTTTKTADQKQKAQGQLALYISTHCAFKNIDHLSGICNNIFEDSKASGFSMHKTKCTCIIQNVLAPHFIKQLLTDIGESYYSIIIDESTDISVTKLLGIVIRYYSEQNNKFETSFLALTDLYSGTSDGIVEGIERILKLYKLSIKKMIGIGTDNAAVMTGVNNGVHAKLKSKYNLKSLVLVRCVCHSLQLAVVSAAKTSLPDNLEYILKETHNWFSHSSLRQKTYEKIYQLINSDAEYPQKIPMMAQTRWLSIEKSVKAILKMWLELKTLFNTLPISQQCYTSNELKNMFNNDINYIYLVYLADVLKDVQRVNLAFEAKNADHTKLFDDLHSLLKILICKIIRPGLDFNYLTDYIDIQQDNIFCMGYNFEEACQLKKINMEEKRAISQKCIIFVNKLVEEIRARLPDNYKMLSKISRINVKNVLSHIKDDIMPLATQFEDDGEILSCIENGWRMIHLMQWQNISSTIDFWTEVKGYKDAIDVNPFEALANLAIKLLSLPYSNAEVERVFSAMNLFKTKIRNRMSLHSVNALLHIKNGLKRENSCCETYQIPDEVNIRINSNDVYKTSEFEIKTVLWTDNSDEETIDFDIDIF